MLRYIPEAKNGRFFSSGNNVFSSCSFCTSATCPPKKIQKLSFLIPEDIPDLPRMFKICRLVIISVFLQMSSVRSVFGIEIPAFFRQIYVRDLSSQTAILCAELNRRNPSSSISLAKPHIFVPEDHKNPVAPFPGSFRCKQLPSSHYFQSALSDSLSALRLLPIQR